MVVPEPRKGSITNARVWLLLVMARSIRAIGFIVGCSGEDGGLSASQTDASVRDPCQEDLPRQP